MQCSKPRMKSVGEKIRPSPQSGIKRRANAVFDTATPSESRTNGPEHLVAPPETQPAVYCRDVRSTRCEIFNSIKIAQVFQFVTDVSHSHGYMMWKTMFKNQFV